MRLLALPHHDPGPAPRHAPTSASRRCVLALAGCCALVAQSGAALAARRAEPTPPDGLSPGLAQRLSEAAFLLVGEQHDAPAHQQTQAHLVRQFARQRRLAAVVLEMAESGHDTRSLDARSDDETVRRALAWDEAAWPWARYQPVVMAAVAAGVPVWGGNLPRRLLRQAMADASLDRAVAPAVLARQRQAMEESHCGLLPPSQHGPMARVQIARDRSLAATLEAAWAADPLATAPDTGRPGRLVLLVAGAGHVLRDRGVPLHLRGPQRATVLWLQAGEPQPLHDGQPLADLRLVTAAPPPVDHCAALRARFAPGR